MRKWFFSAAFFFVSIVFEFLLWCVGGEVEYKCKKKHGKIHRVCMLLVKHFRYNCIVGWWKRTHRCVCCVCDWMMCSNAYILMQTWVFELQTVSLWWLFGRCFDQSHIIIGMWGMKLFVKHRLTREKESNGYVGQNDGASETKRTNFVRAIWHTHRHVCVLSTCMLCADWFRLCSKKDDGNLPFTPNSTHHAIEHLVDPQHRQPIRNADISDVFCTCIRTIPKLKWIKIIFSTQMSFFIFVRVFPCDIVYIDNSRISYVALPFERRRRRDSNNAIGNRPNFIGKYEKIYATRDVYFFRLLVLSHT